MKSSKARALKAAEEHMRMSGRWLASFDRCVHRVRYWNVRYALRRCLYNKELQAYDRGDSPNRRMLEAMKKAMDEAHDMKLSEEGNMHTCAEAARGAEMMARIYYEEWEEARAEVQLVPHPQRWDHDG